MERRHRLTSCRRDSGFSLIEVLVVCAIIMILLAIALPGIAQYVRNYRIMGRQQVAAALQDARTRAISRNAEGGVSFAVVGRDRYRVILDDAVLNGTAADQLGAVQQLPQGVVFDVAPGAVVLATGVSFTRLGALVDFDFPDPCAATETVEVCNPAPPGSFGLSAAGAILRLREPATGLWQDILVAPGGRIIQTQTNP